MPVDVADEMRLVERALCLRRAGKLGPLWAENGRYFISESEDFPYECRRPVSLIRLREIVERAEMERKPVQLGGQLYALTKKTK